MSECGTPKRSTDQPTSRRISGRSTSTSFGPTTAAFDRYASSTSTRTAVGSEDDVVVAEQQERRARDGGERVVGRGREAVGLDRAGRRRAGRTAATRAWRSDPPAPSPGR